MANLIERLRKTAVSLYRRRVSEKWDEGDSFFAPDSAFAYSQRIAAALPPSHPSFRGLAKDIFAEPELTALGHRNGERDPFVLHPEGGVRLSPGNLVAGLFICAFQQIYWFGLPNDEDSYAGTVLACFEDLRRAALGEPVLAHTLTGVVGMTLPQGKSVATPWGTLRPTGPITDPHHSQQWQTTTTCTLTESLHIPIKFDRAAAPDNPFRPRTVDSERVRVLFPIACALASKGISGTTAPLLTWSTFMLPFYGTLGYSTPRLPPVVPLNVDLADVMDELENWSRVVERHHSPSIDLAAKRLVSAIGRRTDRTDALIDAVIVWESLVGTSSETSFRVTGALAKMIETEPGKRRSLMKELRDVYGVRSRVVHGAEVPQKDLQSATTQAITAAVQALRICYERGPEWQALTSEERANKVLLEWP